jgi:hypothetical protein
MQACKARTQAEADAIAKGSTIAIEDHPEGAIVRLAVGASFARTIRAVHALAQSANPRETPNAFLTNCVEAGLHSRFKRLTSAPQRTSGRERNSPSQRRHRLRLFKTLLEGLERGDPTATIYWLRGRVQYLEETLRGAPAVPENGGISHVGSSDRTTSRGTCNELDLPSVL